MASEILKTEGTVLSIHPWSRTSHIVRWLTPDAGCVTTVVKGAVRPKSIFLGQYDLFYTNELLYYARAHGEAHALRETSPCQMRECLRGRWRETLLAFYAAHLVEEYTPSSVEAAPWFQFLNHFLDGLAAINPPRDLLGAMILLEAHVLSLAGLFPELPAAEAVSPWVAFSIDQGVVGEMGRVMRLTPEMIRILNAATQFNRLPEDIAREIKISVLRFLGMFLTFHAEVNRELRRNVYEAILN